MDTNADTADRVTSADSSQAYPGIDETEPSRVADAVRQVPITRLTVELPFVQLFIEQPDVIERAAQAMRESGFDRRRAIDVWMRGRGRKLLVLDGHQRLMAAPRAGLASVWVVYRRFPGPESALC